MSKRRVVLGGSYAHGTWILRATHRIWYGSEGRVWDYGFRIVIVRRGKA